MKLLDEDIMNQKTLEIFFTGKFFKIPVYQRDYSWNNDNIDDLFEDITESIETKTNHYIGTFILSQKEDEEFYEIVDGQQRLTTLSMLLNLLINNLDSNNDKIINREKFIYSDNKYRLELLNQNKQYFIDLLESKKSEASNRSQTLLLKEYNYIEDRIKSLKDDNSYSIKQWLDCIKKLEVMEFIEKDEGKAIRIFQTVNDRGKPLSNIEKAKSLLIYYSNRFLNGELDNKINNKFGIIFNNFNIVKEIAENEHITLISKNTFTEDSVMRYHFLSFEHQKYDYKATENYVLDTFLKGTLKSIKMDQEKLRNFIDSYVSDLNKFFESFVQLLQKTDQKKYYKLFSILDLSASLYPLTIRLETMNLLDQNLPIRNHMTFLDLIEVADLRVYKTRGTDPARDVSYLARDASRLSEKEIESKLAEFIEVFMPLSEFKSKMESDVYRNKALKHIFIEYDEQLLLKHGKQPYSTQNLRDLNNTVPTVEHIFPKEPTFDFPDRDFDSKEEYFRKNNVIGNFVLLEKMINSACQNKPPEQKIIDRNLYSKSLFFEIRFLTAELKNNGNNLSKNLIDKRTQRLSDFCTKRWEI